MIHFKLHEFDCKSEQGSAADNMDSDFLSMLDSARGIAGIPFRITSGFRSKKHNQTLKHSVPNSSHLIGKAADIAVGNGQERLIILHALIKAGFRRIGVSKGFLHADNDSIEQGGTKPNSVWTY